MNPPSTITPPPTASPVPTSPLPASQVQSSKFDVQCSTFAPFQPSPKESDKALQSFLCYFDLGDNRSLAKVADAMSVSLKTVKHWASRFEWRARLKAYNARLVQARMETETAARQNQAQSWAERTNKLKELEWNTSEKLLEVLQRHLDALLEAEPGKLSLSDLARALEAASRIGRLATGLATDKQEFSGPDGGPIRLEFETALRKIYGPIVDVQPVPSSPDPAASLAPVGVEGQGEGEAEAQPEAPPTLPAPSSNL